ncbi:flavin-containing monooxygenase FMO [Novosphingobium aromaticivorans DSM 12444]|uniref:Flavin-containing monooxygenase FMO n=1 Tax=Novosphingobium aromaticivorans (strain ATCC 700278 / DSM 12444 / CCUG 56034 / CIP 105152 / NBRC 16084 / F199) TaxID=279238 RepID=Q2GA38_NOVAD|nr:NAD(P)/FAD-dependent oxidoreductase [Novosphingobium aromaticivorans]ABD25285.1 flavin-containing monooxygenase FMO [Novosphingobium aromaticivorans DSM 12444]SCX88880.1 Predicted flavoprotein CzcO associated with the cation diffusion facilitator CzcD [Novosphingobium aromaticivorans]
MGAEQSRFVAANPDVDVLIVGAGISGIGMAAHMKMLCPDRSFAIVERRAQIGGTWDLFRYPGVRSDSDMHTLGFVFEPWKHEKSIADGPAILEYLNRIADERDIRRHIRFDSKVLSADFDSEAAHWVVTVEGPDGERRRLTARWLYLGSGYYDYDTPYEAHFEGRADFRGQIIHPQFWPENFDYSGKRVVVIGSGATAVTIVPSMADTAAHVTMLQRTPTWYGIRPARDAIANFLRKILPEELAYRITRFKNVRLQNLVFKRARTQPEKVKQFLTKRIKAALGDKYDEKAFTPPYNPWDQRLCLVPDADLFEAIKAGKASVVTDHIDRFDATGIKLKSGQHLDADVIVTATGLKMVMAGKIAISVDGVPVDFAEKYYYKGAMFSNVPNLAAVFGYLNASWTLRADINARYICDVLNAMKAKGMEVAVPKLAPNHPLDDDNIYDFSSGYIERARHLLPKSAHDMRWRLNQDYVRDRVWMREDPIEDGVLQFGHARPAMQADPQMEAAE